MSYIESNWENCYDDSWKGIIVDEAMSHPAKYSRGLITRIIKYAIDEGYVQPGQVVLDPFAGQGGGALPCLQSGLHYVGVELEQKFVTLAQQNINLWNTRYAAHFPRWGTAQVLQGDSRQLSSVIAGAGLIVGSPPYTEGVVQKSERPETENTRRMNELGRPGNGKQSGNITYGSTPGQLGAMVVGSPPFAGNTGGRGEASRNGIDAALFDRHSGGMKRGTGDNPANLDHLPQGQPPMIVSSPPYAESMERRGGIDPAKSNHVGGPHSQMNRSDTRYGETAGQLGAMVVGSPPFAGSVGSDNPAKRGGILVSDPKRANDVNLTGSYGDAPGQLGAMVVGSPPFENVGNYDDRVRVFDQTAATLASRKNAGVIQKTYGSTPNQLGNATGETFWTAAAVILSECAAILPPGGYAIWVLKAYVKSGKVVDFPGQWQALCEASGFETVEVIRAMLVKDKGEQVTIAAGFDTSASTTNLMGETVETEGTALANKRHKSQRKSFFRLLAEKKGAPRIDWETVLVTRRRPDAQLALFTEAAGE